MAPRKTATKTVAKKAAATPAPIVRPSHGGAMQYVTCRAMQHSWHHRGVDGQRYGEGRRFGAIPWVSVCTECKTERTKWINRRGETIGLDYDRSACPEYSETGDDKHSPQQWHQSFAEVLFRDSDR